MMNSGEGEQCDNGGCISDNGLRVNDNKVEVSCKTVVINDYEHQVDDNRK